MQTTGRWKLGLGLALVTAVCWGVLPVALKIILTGLDAYTLVWYRFAVSAAVLLLILAATGNLPKFATIGSRGWLLLGIGLAGLLANYLFYTLGLHFSTPTVTQVVIQLAPIFFLLAGLVVFKEPLSWMQRVGVALLILGLLLFFNRRLPQLMQLSVGEGLGVGLVALSALAWAIYGIVQKKLTRRLGPQQILLLIYIGAVVLLGPFSHPSAVGSASLLVVAALAFACANTLIAYGAFAEALRHWDASRIGAILATGPLITMASMQVMERFFPGLIAPEGLNGLSALGAILVVSGAALSALASR